MNVVNYGPDAVTVSLERDGARAVDFSELITGESTAGQTVELQPLTPYLFSLDFPASRD
ncbi:hypothetical protein D3C72_2536230 [compost metagenome]